MSEQEHLSPSGKLLGNCMPWLAPGHSGRDWGWWCCHQLPLPIQTLQTRTSWEEEKNKKGKDIEREHKITTVHTSQDRVWQLHQECTGMHMHIHIDTCTHNKIYTTYFHLFPLNNICMASLEESSNYWRLKRMIFAVPPCIEICTKYCSLLQVQVTDKYRIVLILLYPLYHV